MTGTASDTPPIIRFIAVSKRFAPGVTAVDGVSLDIVDNEFFALLGPSGCGKTTLLRILAGFEQPSAGSVLLDGRDVTRMPPNRRPVNMVFQSYAVFPHMTVGANVAYGLKVSGVPRAEIGPRVAEALALVHLSDHASRRPHQLSGGQLQRVALARALVKRPKVLLLDEPLSALDRKLREGMQLELVRLRHEVGITFVMVTHDQEEAMSVASRIGVMDSGRLVQTGTADEVYEHPQTRFVADFVGSINLFEGRVGAVDGGTVRLESDEAGTGLTAAEDRARAAAPPGRGDRAWLGVRPEKVSVGQVRPDGGANVVAGTVLELAYLGERSICHVRLDSGKIVKASLPNERCFGGLDVAAGETVFVSWAPASSILLTG